MGNPNGTRAPFPKPYEYVLEMPHTDIFISYNFLKHKRGCRCALLWEEGPALGENWLVSWVGWLGILVFFMHHCVIDLDTIDRYILL
jgi:hypothetical protein